MVNKLYVKAQNLTNALKKVQNEDVVSGRKKYHSDYRKVLLDLEKNRVEGANVFSVILLFCSEKQKPDKSTVEARHTDTLRPILNK